MKRFVGLLLCLIGGLNLLMAQERVDAKEVTIVRDDWGVPHIYAKTDAQAAYGLMWAHCEDDFKSIQEALLAMQSRLSEVQGPGGAVLDVMVFLSNPDLLLEREFETAFSPQFRKVLEASVQGLNDYAKNHPKEVMRKGIFPTNEREIIKGYLLAQVALSNAVYSIGRIFSDKMETFKPPMMTTGSNGFALQRKKMKEGNTVMVSNTHQPLEGFLGWYEAHVHSEEGWNMLGGKFSTGVTLFVGTNENLGWTHTTNYPDLADVYQLTMHPTKKNMYKYDGEWLELEERKMKLKVKVGPIRVPFKKKFYWSKHGTVIKNKTGFYAIRYPAMFNVRAAEQWYWMNKAQNMEEFKEALEMQALACQNVIYADKEDNIFFISNGQFPYRNKNYDWSRMLPGDTSAVVWEPKFQPLKNLPQITNPQSGYLYNCNNTPFSATDPAEDLKAADFDPTMGFNPDETNRSIRFQELIKDYPTLSYEDLKKIKYDRHYASSTFYTWVLENLDDMMNVDVQKYPDLADVMEVGKRWDRGTQVDNEQAAIFAIGIVKVLKHIEAEIGAELHNTIPEDVYIEALRWSKEYMLKHYGKLEVPLGEVQYHIRGEVEIPIGGMPENLAPSFMYEVEKGKFRVNMGESYIMLVRYEKGGEVLIETVHPYGASNRPESPHYTDQMELYAKQKLKKMTLDKASVLQNAKEKYHPGERKQVFRNAKITAFSLLQCIKISIL